MANVYKVLAQNYPNAITNTDIYTVGAGKNAIISTIAIANTTGSQLTFRIAVRPAGETLANKHYIAYDSKVAGNDTNFVTIGATLGAGDVVTVYVATQGISFNLYGTEIS
jgi:hypothetical protein